MLSTSDTNYCCCWAWCSLSLAGCVHRIDCLFYRSQSDGIPSTQRSGHRTSAHHCRHVGIDICLSVCTRCGRFIFALSHSNSATIHFLSSHGASTTRPTKFFTLQAAYSICANAPERSLFHANDPENDKETTDAQASACIDKTTLNTVIDDMSLSTFFCCSIPRVRKLCNQLPNMATHLHDQFGDGDINLPERARTEQQTTTLQQLLWTGEPTASISTR